MISVSQTHDPAMIWPFQMGDPIAPTDQSFTILSSSRVPAVT
jgi:hypothetical protein